MRRDEEIRRLVQYAEALGLKVEYRIPTGLKKFVGAEVVSVNGISSTLVIYKHKNTSKLQLILYFLHELGHHLSWIYKNRKDDPKLLQALYEEGNRKEGDPPIAKRKRRLIYIMEKEDAEYRDFVAHELNIKLPKHALQIDKELDEWIYRMYYENGDAPSTKLIIEKKKELTEDMR